MSDGLKMAMFIVLLASVSLVAVSLGITATEVELPANLPEPETGGFWESITAPLVWGWTAISGFFALMTFQVEGLPAVIGALMSAIVVSVLSVFIIRIVRGGG